jgi:predicted Zn finger-like uncharacterized protein
LKISCPSCEAKYSIGDEKVQNRLAKIRCRKCGADIVIDGRVAPPSISLGSPEGTGAAAPASVGGTAGSALEFTVDFAENDQRTMNLGDLVAAYNAGYVTAETYVWSEGMAEWTPLGQVPSIVSALNAHVAAPASAAASNLQRGASAAKQSQVATARATTKGAGRDLFGKVARAGSEEDVAAAQSGYEAQPPTATTGVRNESSVLFSLSALTATTKTKTAVPTASASLTSALDDSGLIDLKALASQASSAVPDASSPLGGSASLGLAPLGGLGAPLGGMPFGGSSPSPLTAADLAPPPKNKTGLFIGGGIAVAAIIVALAIALRPEPPPPPQPEPAPLPRPTLTIDSQPSAAVAKPPPTGTEDSTAKKAPKYKGGGGRKPSKSGGDSNQSGGDTPAPRATPAAGPHCGCAPTDLPCNMRCSAKGG